jgi:hypothetical protein
MCKHCSASRRCVWRVGCDFGIGCLNPNVCVHMCARAGSGAVAREQNDGGGGMWL